MTNTLVIEVEALVKRYGGMRPLRVQALRVKPGDTLVISGLDAGAAETFVHLVSGASVPDEGAVRVEGVDTRDISTDTEWLSSLDRFGIVTHRAVFIEGLPVAANLALPLTLSVDPMSAEIRAQVEVLADIVDIPRARLDEKMGAVTAAERLRVHLARAFAPNPRLLLLEHPTAMLESQQDREAFGVVLQRAARARGIGFLALSEDPHFGAASGAARLKLNPASGALGKAGGWWPFS
jgi:ABC-type lipoprotein export system ATPase subunit